MTHSSETSQLRCGRADRIWISTGKLVWLSPTSAAHRSHRSNRSWSRLTVVTCACRASNSGPQFGSPARASSSVTSASRDWYVEYSVGRYPIRSAMVIGPVDAARKSRAVRLTRSEVA
jgi:hypothetical protein